MSEASEKARKSFGAALASGMQSRAGKPPAPRQEPAQTTVDASPADRLATLEKLIEDSVVGYQSSLRELQQRHRQELGELLGQIQADPALHEAAGYEKFGHYVTGRWKWDRSYAYRLIDLAMVRRALLPLGPPAVNGMPEGQARELAPVVRHNGDDAARELWQEAHDAAASRGVRVTAVFLKARREHHRLGVPTEVSPIGDTDEDEVVDAELVDDEVAEMVNRELRSAADAAEKALRQLDAASALNVAPYDAAEASRDLSRIRTAALRLSRRAEGR